MVVDLPRRWRWVVAAECALIAILAVLFVLASRSAERKAGEPAPANLVVVRSPPTRTVPENVATEPAGQAPSGVAEVEVCGAGWVPEGPNGLADPSTVARLSAPARERILAAMRTDSSELVRASAMLLEPASDFSATLDALARVAQSTSDPAVYALAFRECFDRGEGACRLLSPERWAQLEPDNANPWVYIFEAAHARNDHDAQQEALFRIASARLSRTGVYATSGAVVNAAPDDDLSQLAAASLVTQAMGTEAAIVVRGYREIMAACRADLLKDANRAQTCGAIAERLTDHSDSLAEHDVGAVIGRQAGWPADRVDLLLGESAAFRASLETASSGEDLSCDAIAQRLDSVRQIAVTGQTAALREWVAQSGKPAEDFIQEERARQAPRIGSR